MSYRKILEYKMITFYMTDTCPRTRFESHNYITICRRTHEKKCGFRFKATTKELGVEAGCDWIDRLEC